MWKCVIIYINVCPVLTLVFSLIIKIVRDTEMFPRSFFPSWDEERKQLLHEAVSSRETGGTPASSFFFVFLVVNYIMNQNKRLAGEEKSGEGAGTDYKPCSMTEAVW